MLALCVKAMCYRRRTSPTKSFTPLPLRLIPPFNTLLMFIFLGGIALKLCISLAVDSHCFHCYPDVGCDTEQVLPPSFYSEGENDDPRKLILI